MHKMVRKSLCKSTRTRNRPERLRETEDPPTVEELLPPTDPPPCEAVPTDPPTCRPVHNLMEETVASTVQVEEGRGRHPSDNYSKVELYEKWNAAKKALCDSKEDNDMLLKQMKVVEKEIVYYQRKVDDCESVKDRYQQSCTTVHQLKTDKKVLADQLKAAVSEARRVEASKQDAKDLMLSKHRHEQECLKLLHQSELSKKGLEQAKGNIALEAKEDKIKTLKSDITVLLHKAKQYDNIAASGIKSMMALKAFNERATSR